MTEWNEQLLIDTSGGTTADMVFTSEEIATANAEGRAPVSGTTTASVLGMIRDIGNDLAAVINLGASTARRLRASSDAEARASSELALLQSRWNRENSEALGAMALRQARAMITAARTQGDLDAALLLLAKAKAAQDAEAASRASAPGVSTADVALGVIGAAAVALAFWRYRASVARR